jgi:Tfp pilus assembly protein PilF
MADDYNDDRVTTAPGLMWLGVGLMLTEYPKNAHRVFKEALASEPKLALAKRLWADLYASKYDYRKADPLYREVAGDVMATVGRARVAIESDRAFAEAVELLTPLVEAAPECVPCHNVLALVDIHNERPEDAARRLEEQALKVAPKDGEALALLGAAYYLMDAPAFKEVERRALAVNPKASGFYVTVADHAAREHRYVEAIALLERALALDPEDWNALGALGTGYSRTGQDDKAKELLDKAFGGDPFNVRVYNLLAHFYDKADKRFAWFEAAPMRVRVDKVEAEVLAKVLPPLLQEAERTLRKK